MVKLNGGGYEPRDKGEPLGHCKTGKEDNRQTHPLNSFSFWKKGVTAPITCRDAW